MCADTQCAQHFKGSPVDVTYTVSINKGLKVTPGSVGLTALAGVTASAKLVVQLPAGATSFTATTTATWLNISGVTASGMTLTAAGKAPGVYSALVTVSAANRQVTVPVTYNVGNNPASVNSITPERASLGFTAPAGYASTAQQMKVTLPAWATGLSSAVVYDSGSGWLSVNVDAAGALNLVASAVGLRPGNYAASLVLNGGPDVLPVSLPVSLNVLAPDWSVSGSSSFSVNAASTAAGLSGQISIDIPNLPVQTWQASSNASWLTLSRGSGALRTDKLGISVNVAEMLKLANGRTHTAAISLSVASGKADPTTFTVTLDKKLAELNFVSPHTRLPGEAGNYIVRGSGFDALADVSKALQVSGAVPAKVVRVNDTQLEVSLPAATGDATFAIANTLGAPVGAATLKALAQPAMAYAAIDTQGRKGGMVFDPERQAVYTINKTLSSLMRFQKNGASWDVSSVPVPDADAVAIAPDGKSLIVTVTSGQIQLFDPATLASQGSYKAGYVSGDTLNALPRLAVRNDGKVLFAGGSGVAGAGGMAYFDLASRSFGNIGGSYAFGWAVASGDGSHLNIVQSASYSPQPPMVSLDGTDSAAKPAPGGLTFWYEAAQSLRGERFAEGTYTVWDRDFNIIGKVALPDANYFGRTPVFSPDGKRLYVLAYSSAGLYLGSTVMPRVYVFDSSTRMVTSTNLPLLGSFDLKDYPTCNIDAYECDTRALGAISPDGATLFFIGDARLVVAPVPALSASRAAMRRLALPVSR
ncbi:PD40 domain-containing protein [Duganella radicis]|uniref:BACON domain-containing protein n=1 Tax=Duganella radicis TaxID=551988 RepID=A0A6L6PEU8_9BURK|nr:PD40 domain-containing protein [Duganella radicis]MTV37616.1 hypothetical protein [Duganella radicis]